MRKMLSLVAVSAIFFAQGPSLAQTGQGPDDWDRTRPGVAGEPGSGVQAPDSEVGVQTERLSPEDFIYLAAMSFLFDIEVAQLAMTRAEDGAVRAFAGRILADRRASLDALRLSAAAGEAPAELDDDNRRIVEALAKEQGADFDVSFVGMMVDAHEDALDLYQEFMEATADDWLRSFVGTRVTRLRAALEEARQLESALESVQPGVSR